MRNTANFFMKQHISSMNFISLTSRISSPMRKEKPKWSSSVRISIQTLWVW